MDKPLATSAADGRRLVEEARRRAVPLTVFQNRRWDGDFLTLERLLAEGALGEPVRLESRFDRWRPAPKPGWRESGAPEEAGGLLFTVMEFVPVPVSYGVGGTCAGVAELLGTSNGSTGPRTAPRTVAVLPHVVPLLGELLGRPLSAEPAAGGARAGLIRLLDRG